LHCVQHLGLDGVHITREVIDEIVLGYPSEALVRSGIAERRRQTVTRAEVTGTPVTPRTPSSAFARAGQLARHLSA
jgi:hypothetical protein